MKVSSVKKMWNNAIGPVLIGTTFVASSLIILHGQGKAEQRNREYVQKHSPEKYQLLNETNAKSTAWAKAVEQIKLDSIAQTNYAKGMQAVRDSLANANVK